MPSFPKQPRYKNEDYRRFVASQDCFGCGLVGWSQCAHANGGGMGTKKSDLETFPLCASRPGELGCHARFDQLVALTREERRGLERIYVERMQEMARKAGRKEFA